MSKREDKEAFKSLESFKAAVVAKLIGAGLDAPWAELLVSGDEPWLEANWRTLSVDQAVKEVFSPPIPEDVEDYKQGVGSFLHEYRVPAEDQDQAIDRNEDVVRQLWLMKAPMWCAAAYILKDALGLVEEARSNQAEREPGGEAARQLAVKLKQAQMEAMTALAGSGIAGATVEEVAETLITMALLQMVGPTAATAMKRAKPGKTQTN